MSSNKDAGGRFSNEWKTCAVIGGRGFVGRALVEKLLKLGNWVVRIVDSSSQTPQVNDSDSILSQALASERAYYFNADVRDKPQIIKAFEGVSVVFYMDPVVSFPQDFSFCYTKIVQGAKNVINACRECKVKRLIYSSSADVVFDDTRDIINGDESLPYSGQFRDIVTDLRAQAEALVLAANDSDGLLTCALRPCNVFGPGEEHLMGLLVNAAKSNWAKFIIGSGDNLSDFTYVDNVAHALICAEKSLSSRVVSVFGKVFFISNLEPMKFWEFASLVLEGLGYQRPIISFPAWMVRPVVSLTKLIHTKSGSKSLDSCDFIYNIAALALRTRTFSCSAAQKHLQYSPVVSMEEGIALTVDTSSHLATDSPLMSYNDSNEQSKMDKLLGSGKVADILLWKDEKKTFFCCMSLALLFQLYFLSGRTFISSTANLLLLIAMLLCGHQILPSSIYGLTIPKFSSSSFEISEIDMRNSLLTVTCTWNGIGRLIKSLAQGADWSTFLKVSGFLYICKLIIPHSLSMAIGVALVLAFTLCLVYEQYESEIDGIAISLFNIFKKASRNLPMSDRWQ